MIYCTLKIEVIETLTKFVLFSFLYLGNIRGTYSKYLENNISDTDALFTAQLSTTGGCFVGILYKFNVSNESLSLK